MNSTWFGDEMEDSATKEKKEELMTLSGDFNAQIEAKTENYVEREETRNSKSNPIRSTGKSYDLN